MAGQACGCLVSQWVAWVRADRGPWHAVATASSYREVDAAAMAYPIAGIRVVLRVHHRSVVQPPSMVTLRLSPKKLVAE